MWDCTQFPTIFDKNGCTLQTCAVFRSVAVSTRDGGERSKGQVWGVVVCGEKRSGSLQKLLFNNGCVGTADPRVRRLGLEEEGNHWLWTQLNSWVPLHWLCLCGSGVSGHTLLLLAQMHGHPVSHGIRMLAEEDASLLGFISALHLTHRQMGCFIPESFISSWS